MKWVNLFLLCTRFEFFLVRKASLYHIALSHTDTQSVQQDIIRARHSIFRVFSFFFLHIRDIMTLSSF